MEEENLTGRVSALNNIIKEQKLGNDAESVQRRVEIIRELEKILKTNFYNTKDFNCKITDFIVHRSNSPEMRKK